MATRRYSIAPGQNEYQVVEAVGAAVVSAPVEITIDLANIAGLGNKPPSRQDVIMAIEKFQHWILRGVWPPA